MNLEEIINAAVEKKINEMVESAISRIHHSYGERDGARERIYEIVEGAATREIESRKAEIEQRVIEEMKNMHINWTAKIEVQSEPPKHQSK